MNYTKNYHLPQWDETDRIMRVDFNQMCADMEAGLNKNAQAAAAAKTQSDQGVTNAAGAQAAAEAAMAAAQAAQTSADGAQDTADGAQGTADAALAKANAAYCPTNLPYVTGCYTGTGLGNDQAVTLGFRPRFLIITCPAETDWHRLCTISTNENHAKRLEFTNTGFLVSDQVDSANQYVFPILNSRDKKYLYIAFR